MELNLFLTNLRNPTLLFFVLGIIAAFLRSDLEIPTSTIQFIALYLIFSIGYKGGESLCESFSSKEALQSIFIVIAISLIITFYVFFLVKKEFIIHNAGAVAATFGSVSAITFIETALFCDEHHIQYGGYMVGGMALVEIPPIFLAALLIHFYSGKNLNNKKVLIVFKKMFSSSYILITMGSLIIGFLSGKNSNNVLDPFVNDLFKGFLAIFLIAMGRKVWDKMCGFTQYKNRVIFMTIIIPILNGCLSILITHFFKIELGNRFLICMISASASYILVPSALGKIAPKSDAQLYLPMALGVTFPINLIIGLPLYWNIINHF